MKKISLYAASLVAFGLGFSACDQLHNDLRLEVPTEYNLDTPEGIDQLITFGMTGSNVNNEWNVVTHYPYNVNTVADYQVQVAKSEEDFKKWDELVSAAIQDGESSDYDFKDEAGLPYVNTVAATFTSPSFTVAGADFCDGVNAVYGFESEADIIGPVKVAYRVHAWIPGVEYSSIFSNVVVLSEVKSYIPIRDPRSIYVIGQPQGWDINSDKLKATEVDPGSNIYYSKFSIASGQFMFRFYTELGDWETNSLGSQVDDNPIDIEFTDGEYTGPVVAGKGSWNYPDWTGGTVEVTVDLNDYTISIIPHEGEEGEDPTQNLIYLRGDFNGWGSPAADAFVETGEEGVYLLPFVSMPSGTGFKVADKDWSAINLGGPSGGSIKVGEVFNLDGGENITLASDFTGYVVLTNTGSGYTLQLFEYEAATAGASSGIFLRGGFDESWNALPEYEFKTTSYEGVIMLENKTIEEGIEFKVADANWGPIDYGYNGGKIDFSKLQNVMLAKGGGNISMTSSFTGSFRLITLNGAYFMQLIPE